MAKNVFQIHGITQDDEVAFNRPLKQPQLVLFFSKLNPCLTGVEAWSSTHQWGCKLMKFGHDVRQTNSHPERASAWLTSLLDRKPSRLATVAMASKTARIVWAVLTQSEPYAPHSA